jgi:predicted DNA binding CopG/RHH family protein
MKKKTNEKEIFGKYPNYFKPLDEEEMQLQKDLDSGLYVVNNDKEEKNRISGIFKEYFKKHKRDGLFTIRINKKILSEVETVANENGMNYQTFINMLLFKIAKRELVLKIDAV